MNKGIAAAAGQFVLHLNAGDRLLCIPRRDSTSSADIDVACFAVKVDGCRIFRPEPDSPGDSSISGITRARFTGAKAIWDTTPSTGFMPTSTSTSE